MADLCVSVVLLFLLEAASWRFVLSASIQQMKNLFPFQLFLNLLVLISFIQLIRFLNPLGRFSRSLVFAVGVFLALANYLKTLYLGRPLEVSDVYLLKHGSLLLRYAEPLIPLVALGAGGLTLVAVWKGRFRNLKITLPGRLRTAAFFGAITVVLGLVYFRELGLADTLAKNGVQTVVWNRSLDVSQNGFLVSSLASVRLNAISRPTGYSEESVSEVLVRTPGSALWKKPGKQRRRGPNVVLVLMESMWDPAVAGLQMKDDPLKNFKRLGRQGAAGTFVTPVFGGGTANAGFEILTGLSTRFIPPGSIAFQQFVHQRLGSLADGFSRAGYDVFSLHNWDRKFWRRDEVLPLLGIDRFVGIDELSPEWGNGFPDDKIVFDRTLEAIRTSKQPVFSYLITISTHGPYELSGYVKAMRKLDQRLGEFTAELKKHDEETVVVVFGDHLPVLGGDFGTYVKSGFISSSAMKSWNIEESLKMHSTPLLAWSNKRNLGARVHKPWRVSANYLGLDVLRFAGIEANTSFLRYLTQLRRRFPVIHPDFLIDSDGNAFDLDSHLNQDLSDYGLLFYDRMFGKNFSSSKRAAFP